MFAGTTCTQILTAGYISPCQYVILLSTEYVCLRSWLLAHLMIKIILFCTLKILIWYCASCLHAVLLYECYKKGHFIFFYWVKMVILERTSMLYPTRLLEPEFVGTLATFILERTSTCMSEAGSFRQFAFRYLFNDHIINCFNIF